MLTVEKFKYLLLKEIHWHVFAHAIRGFSGSILYGILTPDQVTCGVNVRRLNHELPEVIDQKHLCMEDPLVLACSRLIELSL